VSVQVPSMDRMELVLMLQHIVIPREPLPALGAPALIAGNTILSRILWVRGPVVTVHVPRLGSAFGTVMGGLAKLREIMLALDMLAKERCMSLYRHQLLMLKARLT
jgi:hypothetical protein